MNNTENNLNKVLETLTSTYHKRKEVIETQMQESRIPLLTSHNEKWFKEEREKLVALIENRNMSLEDKNITNVDTFPQKLMDDLKYYEIMTTKVDTPIAPSQTFADENFKKLVDTEDTTLINIDEDLNPTDPSIITNHIGYIKDLSTTVGFGAGTFLTNHLLTSIGLPPMALIKPLVIGGVKVAGWATGAALNFCAANPTTAVMVGTNLPIAYTYIEKGIKKLNTKDEDPVTTQTDPNVVNIPPVPDPVESHSLYEFVEMLCSITWKVLKKIHDLF